MKKLLLAAIVTGALSSLVPAQAAPVGCAVLPAKQDAAGPAYSVQCQYFANGKGEYIALTASSWSITVFHKDADGIEHVWYRDEGAAETVPPDGPKELPSNPGDRVVVTQGSECFAPTPLCGQAGVVASYELHA